MTIVRIKELLWFQEVLKPGALVRLEDPDYEEVVVGFLSIPKNLSMNGDFIVINDNEIGLFIEHFYKKKPENQIEKDLPIFSKVLLKSKIVWVKSECLRPLRHHF